MHKKVLSEINLYSGKIKMPNGFEINREALGKEILFNEVYKKPLVAPIREIDKIYTYQREYMYLRYKFTLINVNSWGCVIPPRQHFDNYLHLDETNLKNEPDFMGIYGVHVNDDSLQIVLEYDSNRRKCNKEKIILKNNEFIIFPSTLRCSILENTSAESNIILNTTYEYV